MDAQGYTSNSTVLYTSKSFGFDGLDGEFEVPVRMGFWAALVLISPRSSSVSASHAAGASGPVNSSSDSGLERKDRRWL